MSCALDLRNQSFGRLTAIKKAVRPEHVKTGTYWECLCECQSRVLVNTNNLVRGVTQSCGCLSREMTKARTTKHGATKDGCRLKSYDVYSGMLQRITNKNCFNYPNYGGRGISICDEWLGKDGYKNFVNDMGEPPSGMTIERKEVNGDYSKDNCVWADKKQQSVNRRNVKLYTLDGQSKCLSDWARDLGISISAIQRRVAKWDLNKALTEKPSQRYKPVL